MADVFWSGASDQIRQLNRSVKPIVEYSRDGDDYIAKASVPALGKEHSHKFRLNVELDETTLDGRKVKVTTSFLPLLPSRGCCWAPLIPISN